MIFRPRDLNAETWHLAKSLDVYDWFFGTRFCPVVPRARKFRLFMAACYRAVWDHLPLPQFRAALEAGEQFADDGDIGSAQDAGWAAWEAASVELSPWRELGQDLSCVALDDPLEGSPRRAWRVHTAGLESTALNLTIFGRTFEQAVALHLRLFHDIFRNPFRPATFAPEWRTDTTTALAAGIYESRDFSAMPILADALQDAGCDNDDILAHCRHPLGEHVRGCWVADLVLSKGMTVRYGKEV